MSLFLRSSRTRFQAFGRGAAFLMTCTALAACSSAPNGTDSRYGVSASRRVYADGQPIPKGGGREQVGKPYNIAGRTYVPREDPNYDNTGVASWYGSDFHGRLTANGEIYDRTAISAAHPTMPLPSYARVTNLRNGRSIVVRVNDRGPYAGNREIDLSERTAELLEFKSKGLAEVRVQYVGRAPVEGSDDRQLMATLTEGGAPSIAGDRVMVAEAGGRAPQVPPRIQLADASGTPGYPGAGRAAAPPDIGPAPVRTASRRPAPSEDDDDGWPAPPPPRGAAAGRPGSGPNYGAGPGPAYGAAPMPTGAGPASPAMMRPSYGAADPGAGRAGAGAGQSPRYVYPADGQPAARGAIPPGWQVGPEPVAAGRRAPAMPGALPDPDDDGIDADALSLAPTRRPVIGAPKPAVQPAPVRPSSRLSYSDSAGPAAATAAVFTRMGEGRSFSALGGGRSPNDGTSRIPAAAVTLDLGAYADAANAERLIARMRVHGDVRSQIVAKSDGRRLTAVTLVVEAGHAAAAAAAARSAGVEAVPVPRR
ncbi:septal ring lytic transglycosylase RlpA family protein [Prosthecodimorpha staleyi]|uniref:Endolytic peptidoglycan transglycosylase RlpA n=1 Tax=Prosthecodimorpha staleyi TaxID=2840188 RepID=A0A947D6Q3_9HYPH|nr:septal ring lytic transglycosylase RlpA family protein [Prosthecodimorpha staleyi]